jgi:hypothetical protein
MRPSSTLHRLGAANAAEICSHCRLFVSELRRNVFARDKNQFCTRLPNVGRGDIWPWTALVTAALKSAKPMNSPLNTEAVMKKLTIRMTTSLISTRAQTDRTTHHARRGSWLRQGPVDMLHCEGG